MVSFWYTIKEDPVYHQQEKERVLNIMNKKYAENEEFRQKRKEYQRLYRLKKKQEKQQQNDISV
jgi:hypothetical protein